MALGCHETDEARHRAAETDSCDEAEQQDLLERRRACGAEGEHTKCGGRAD